MKIFIIFISFLMVFSLMLSFASDMNRYMQCQRLLKMLSEDCAEAAALTIDEKSGNIDKDRAYEAAAEILESSGLFPAGSVAIESLEITREGRGCSVRLSYTDKDLFRFPYIDISSVERVSEYAWE